MANQPPCQMCEMQEIMSPSNALVTAQDEQLGQFMPQMAMWLCMPCLLGLTGAWYQTVQQDFDDHAAANPTEPVTDTEGPGVLEQIETDEGKTPPAPNGRGRKSRTPPESGDAETAGTQAATADVYE